MTVSEALLKCSAAMNIPIPKTSLEVIAEDLVDKYKLESVEDIIECLKKGRRGDYSGDRESRTYGKINVEVISMWMSKHLDAKYLEKERQIRNESKAVKDDDFDAMEFYAKGKEYIEEQKKREKKGGVGMRVLTEEQKKRQYELILPDCSKEELISMRKTATLENDSTLVHLISLELNKR